MLQKQSYRTLLFGATMFVSAMLLFSLQPMVAKMLLPLLGGTPAVWLTCMLFFQTALLAGYAYAVVLSRRRFQRQIVTQFVFLSVAFISLPIGVSSRWLNSVPASGNPSLWLLVCLTLTVGLPYFIVSSSSPLLQKWFSSTTAPAAGDPYFLYSVSNSGSLVALLAYPTLLEPYFSLQLQSRIWTATYALLIGLTGLCSLVLWRRVRNDAKVRTIATESGDEQQIRLEAKSYGERDRPSLGRRLRWLLLAFVPSSLMLAVTTYITSDIASVPLLWIIPLALYLLTMVLAFARRQLFSVRILVVIMPGATLLLMMLYLVDTASGGGWLLILLHLVYFFLAALMCHSQLAIDRPAPVRLAEFYLWLGLGGVLGGVFNALIAPVIFHAAIEYPLVILLVCLLLPATQQKPLRRRELTLSLALPAFIFVLTFGLGSLADKFAPQSVLVLVFALAMPLFLSYPLRSLPVLFALSLGAVTLGAGLLSRGNTQTLHVERNFYGVIRVLRKAGSDLNTFAYGSTVHGRQSTDPRRRCEPLSYYHRRGPLGQIFADFKPLSSNPKVAIVGLGIGAAAAYSRPNERWTFYEINPAVISIAQSKKYFTYLSDCAHAPIDLVMGDARLKLQGAPAESYSLIIVDAFSGDAIPVHLMTQQALDLYLSKLVPSGVLAFHISNRNLDLSPVLAELAHSRKLSCVNLFDRTLPQSNGEDPSRWVVLARSPKDYGSPTDDSQTQLTVFATSGWTQSSVCLRTGVHKVWTDDYSNIPEILKWSKKEP